MLDIVRLLQDLNIPYITEGKNVQSGWLGITCPLCNDHSTHGGFNLTKPELYYHCWRCGHHSPNHVLRCLIGPQTASLLPLYTTPGPVAPLAPKAAHAATRPFKLPGQALKPTHLNYLNNRGYNPTKLIELYQLQGTGPVGPFKHRIIIPIIQNGITVSFLGRDITDQAKLRYKPCPKEEEITPHKHTLYNLDSCKTKDKVIVVEGVTDVWRLGKGIVATYGISYTTEQVKLLRQFKKIFILYDNDKFAQRQANSLANKLASLGRQVEVITGISTDPGEANTTETKEILALLED